MTKKSETTLRITYIIATLAIAAGGWVYAAAWKDAQSEQNAEKIRQLQDDSRKDHDLIIEMKTDITWIRKRLEAKP